MTKIALTFIKHPHIAIYVILYVVKLFELKKSLIKSYFGHYSVKNANVTVFHKHTYVDMLKNISVDF